MMEFGGSILVMALGGALLVMVLAGCWAGGDDDGKTAAARRSHKIKT
jgi:hypothetical protein